MSVPPKGDAMAAAGALLEAGPGAANAQDPVAAGDADGGNDLDRSFARGLAWTSGVKWGSQILTWASTLIVARLLAPTDYGLVGMAALYLGLVTIMSEAGIGSAIVIQRKLTPRQISELNSVSVLAGVGGLLLTLLVARPLGAFFDAPRLPLVMAVMGLSFLITGFRIVPLAVLRRDLRFKATALLEGTHMIVAAIMALTLASFGFGYWALVFGPMSGVLVWTILALTHARVGFAVPHLGPLASALTLSRQLLIGRLAWYGYSNADFLIVGKVLGQAALGVYTIGWSLATIPINKISSMVGSVTPAVFGAAQDDMAAMRRYLRVTTEGLALLTFPAIVGLALVADDVVLLALGDTWADAVWPLRLLAIYATFRSVTPLIPQVLHTVGGARYAMWNAVIMACLLPAGFYIGSHWGLVGVAATWLFVHPLVTYPVARKTFIIIGMKWGEYLASMWPAFSACAIMSAAVLGMTALLPEGTPLVARLIAKVGIGALVYPAAIYLLHRERLDVARGVLKLLRK